MLGGNNIVKRVKSKKLPRNFQETSKKIDFNTKTFYHLRKPGRSGSRRRANNRVTICWYRSQK